MDASYYGWNLFGSSEKDVLYSVIWNKLYKKDEIKNIQFKGYLSEDLLYNTNVLRSNPTIAYIEQPLYYWVQRPTSITHASISKKFINRLDNIEECYKLSKNKSYGDQCLYKFFKNLLSTRFLANHTEFQSYAGNKINNYVKRYTKDFMHAKNITFKEKIAILTFLYIPGTYLLYRKFQDHTI